MDSRDFLSRFQNVKPTGPNRYMACCSAHEDKTPSLAISFIDDGRILCHCFAGCSALEVVSAVGLTLKDLFPDGPIENRLVGATPWLRKERFKAAQSDEHHRLVLEAAKTARERGKRLTAAQMAEERRAWEARKKLQQSE